MIARGASLDAARPAEIGGKHAANAGGVCRRTQERPVIHRLEGKLLVACRHQRLDLGERRASLRRQDKLFGLVQRDAGQSRQVDCRVPLRGPADGALGAAADDFERFFLGQRRTNDEFDFDRIVRFEAIGHGSRLFRGVGGRRRAGKGGHDLARETAQLRDAA